MHKLFDSKQNMFWQAKVKDSCGDPRKLWRTLFNVLGSERKRTSDPSSNLSAEGFSEAFAEKVEGIRAQTASAPNPDFTGCHCSSRLTSFDPVTPEDVAKLIIQAKDKSCHLDPAPTWVMKRFADQLAPFITMLFNKSLEEGRFPTRMKHAIVTPVLKKPNMDATNLSNYRPISNLSFLSKLLERCVYQQTTEYLASNNLMPSKQSAYRPHHSTETAVLDVLSDVAAAADKGQVTLLGLLDLSSAFDTIDHAILLERLQCSFGIADVALSWMRSYLTGRTQAVYFRGVLSTSRSVTTGIPQGSVLGPLNFILYAADILDSGGH